MSITHGVSSMRNTILGMEIDQVSPEEAVKTIIDWSSAADSRYICVSNVHQCMETFDHDDFRNVVNSADMVVPDSQVLIWAARFLGCDGPRRVIRGVDLMKSLCHAAAERNVAVGLYGGTDSSLSLLRSKLSDCYPNLKIAIAIAPPFRDLTAKELCNHAEIIERSGVRLLFVGIGCPKQEKWMAFQSTRIRAVMIGVGAAFDFIGGVTKPSPAWVHPMGLEWLYRLIREPRRLWKRYFKTNPRFILHVLLEKIGRRRPARVDRLL